MDISIAYWQIEDALESREEDAVLKTLEEKFNISDEKLERILTLYDYRLSREGDMLSHYGIEERVIRWRQTEASVC